MNECPARILREKEVAILLPLFFFWHQTFRYPDDRSILKQPTKLRSAFDLMHRISRDRELAIMNAPRKKNNGQ